VFSREEQPPRRQTENIMTKATGIAIMSFLYLLLLSAGVLAYVAIYFHKDELDTFHLLAGVALAAIVVNYAIFKGFNDVMDVVEEK
jgi:hypothetical protein